MGDMGAGRREVGKQQGCGGDEGLVGEEGLGKERA